MVETLVFSGILIESADWKTGALSFKSFTFTVTIACPCFGGLPLSDALMYTMY